MPDKEETSMFDLGLYGMLIRKGRLDLGFRKAEDFATCIYVRTRVRISRDVLYRIESGKQAPDCTQFMAINLALSGSPFYPKIVDLCFSREWQDIINKYEEHPEYNGGHPYIPLDWEAENSKIDYESPF